MKIRVADYVFEISENSFKKLGIISEGYIADEQKTDRFLAIGKKEVLDEREFSSRYYENPNGILHANAVLRAISREIIEINAFLLHAAAFDVDGEGVALCALSGTGKTTQMLNWQKLLGEKMTIVNGDKPIIRFFDKDFCEKNGLDIPEGTEFGVPYAYGTPWRGKEKFGCNMRTPLKHICFIERSDKNFVTKIEKHEAIDRIMKQVYIPKDPEALEKTLQLVNRLINTCDLWIIHCNMEPESAKIAYETIIGE